MEVATARVYNWDIGERRKEKADGQVEGGAENGGKGKGRPNG